MTNVLWIIFWGILTFSFLVVLHEAGHFVAARAFGLKVHEFMVGLPGPRLRFHGKNTTFGITAIPLGGYVRIAGMEPGVEDDRLGTALAAVTRAGHMTPRELSGAIVVSMDDAAALLFTLADWGAVVPSETDAGYDSVFPAEKAEDPRALLDEARSVTYRGQPTWKRITILSAGVVVNLATAILVFTIVLTGWGYYQQSLTIAGTVNGSAAALAGMQEGDTLLALDGEPIDDWMELTGIIGRSQPGDEMTVTYERDGQDITRTVVLGENEVGAPFLGVEAEVEHVEMGVGEALIQSIMWTGLVFRAIIDFFNPETFQIAMEGARGVVGISIEVAEAVRNWYHVFAWLVALLSLSLRMMNILPIPPLDGGKVAIEIIEKVKGAPISRDVVVGISMGGFLLLFAFIGYVMYADVMRYFVNA